MLLIKNIILWCYWGPLKYLVQRLKAPQLYLLAKVLGAFLYLVGSGKKKRLLTEARMINELVSCEREVSATVRSALNSLMCCELEMLSFPVLSPDNMESFCGCQGLENLDRGLARGKGVLLLFSHFGANQMVMPAIGYRGYTMSQLSAPATVWEEKMVGRKFSKAELKGMQKRWEHELSLPVQHINIFGSLKKAFVCLKRNEVLGVAIDGGGGASRETFDFLNKKAIISTGPLQIARRTGCTVLPTFMLREENGRNKMIIEPPLELTISGNLDGIDNSEEAVQAATLAFLERLQFYITSYPEQYVNFLALRRMMAEAGDTPLFHCDQ